MFKNDFGGMLEVERRVAGLEASKLPLCHATPQLKATLNTIVRSQSGFEFGVKYGDGDFQPSLSTSREQGLTSILSPHLRMLMEGSV